MYVCGINLEYGAVIHGCIMYNASCPGHCLVSFFEHSASLYIHTCLVANNAQITAWPSSEVRFGEHGVFYVKGVWFPGGSIIGRLKSVDDSVAARTLTPLVIIVTNEQVRGLATQQVSCLYNRLPDSDRLTRLFIKPLFL